MENMSNSKDNKTNGTQRLDAILSLSRPEPTVTPTTTDLLSASISLSSLANGQHLYYFSTANSSIPSSTL